MEEERIQEIVKLTQKYTKDSFGIHSLRSKLRSDRVTTSRVVFSYIAINMYGHSSSEVAEVLLRDRSTISSYFYKIRSSVKIQKIISSFDTDFFNGETKDGYAELSERSEKFLVAMLKNENLVKHISDINVSHLSEKAITLAKHLTKQLKKEKYERF